MMDKRLLAVTLSTIFALAACGGSDNNASVAAQQASAASGASSPASEVASPSAESPEAAASEVAPVEMGSAPENPLPAECADVVRKQEACWSKMNFDKDGLAQAEMDLSQWKKQLNALGSSEAQVEACQKAAKLFDEAKDGSCPKIELK